MEHYFSNLLTNFVRPSSRTDSITFGHVTFFFSARIYIYIYILFFSCQLFPDNVRRMHTMHLAGDDITAPRTTRYSRDIARGHRARALTTIAFSVRSLARAFERIARTEDDHWYSRTDTNSRSVRTANGSRVPRVPPRSRETTVRPRPRRTVIDVAARATRWLPRLAARPSVNTSDTALRRQTRTPQRLLRRPSRY